MMITDANDNEGKENEEKPPFSFKKNEVPPEQVKAHWEKIAAELAKHSHGNGNEEKDNHPSRGTGRNK